MILTHPTHLAETCAGNWGNLPSPKRVDAGLGATRRSDRTDLADFQCNGAMAAAKAAKRNPREIAGAVANALRDSQLVASAEVAGPGFINVRLSAACLAWRVPMNSDDGEFKIRLGRIGNRGKGHAVADEGGEDGDEHRVYIRPGEAPVA
jgi:hypothetical protein